MKLPEESLQNWVIIDLGEIRSRANISPGWRDRHFYASHRSGVNFSGAHVRGMSVGREGGFSVWKKKIVIHLLYTWGSSVWSRSGLGTMNHTDLDCWHASPNLIFIPVEYKLCTHNCVRGKSDGVVRSKALGSRCCERLASGYYYYYFLLLRKKKFWERWRTKNREGASEEVKGSLISPSERATASYPEGN